MRRFLVQLILVLILATTIPGCSPFVTSTPYPSPQPIQITYTSTMRPWVDTLHQCALEHPEIALITEEISAAALEFSPGNLTLWFGEPPQGFPGYAASLGEDEIVVIAGTDVTLQDLSLEQLVELYSQPSSVYQVWTYSEGNELRSIFDSVVLGETGTSAYSHIAPDPDAMLEAVTTGSLSIGYIPRDWLGVGELQVVTMETKLQRDFKLPILALAREEPEGNLKIFLICLQQSSSP
jgi:hypothetical protein